MKHMNELDDISRKLLNQLEMYEKSAVNTVSKLKEVEEYISTRLKKARVLLPSMKQSNNWMTKLSRVIDILEEIQRVLDKMEDVGAVFEPVDEISMSSIEGFLDESTIANL